MYLGDVKNPDYRIIQINKNADKNLHVTTYVINTALQTRTQGGSGTAVVDQLRGPPGTEPRAGEEFEL